MLAGIVVIPMWVFVAIGIVAVTVVIVAVYLFGRREER